MGAYNLVIKKTAVHDFNNIDNRFKARIESAIDELKGVPFPRGCRHIKARRGFFRIRIGNYRIIYSFNNLTQTVTINHVRLRDKHTYENL